MHANQLPLLSLVRSFMNFVASVQNFIFTANVVINWTEMDITVERERNDGYVGRRVVPVLILESRVRKDSVVDDLQRRECDCSQ